MAFKLLKEKREFVLDKYIVGIDPGKDKHQAAVLDHNGIQIGKSFHFKKSFKGYDTDLWKRLNKLIPHTVDDQHIVFAIETSCNLWQTLAFYLMSMGYTVLLVSPLSTKHTRPVMNHDFSKTDPKDALLVASNTRNGYFDYYQQFTPQINAMHRLSISYTKLNKNLTQNKQRIRSLVEQIFPEFITVLPTDTKTAIYLLKKYLTPEDFLNMDIIEDEKQIKRISRHNHDMNTLLKLKIEAQFSIGVHIQQEEIIAERLSLNAWIHMLETTEQQMNAIMDKLIELAEQTPYWEVLISFKGKGISEKLAALFIAETRDLDLYNHYKKIEKFAGYNLRQAQSGSYVGPRRMSHIGNRRLSWIIYKMTEETARYVPEVRIKFLNRQMNTKSKYRKNIIACSSVLLKLIVALIKQRRKYEIRDEKVKQLNLLEQKYQQYKNRNKIKTKKAA
jgi:transposase